MTALIEQVRRAGDSVGGVVEVIATGVPPGLGEPVFGKLSGELMGALGSIPAVKGVEIGSGFAAARMYGSLHNDALQSQKAKGKGQKIGIRTTTNNAGGILGGISNGMPLVARIAIKPASSIHKEQHTVDKKGKARKIRVEGRHDPCLAPRAVPVAEAMVALTLVDAHLRHNVKELTV